MHAIPLRRWPSAFAILLSFLLMITGCASLPAQGARSVTLQDQKGSPFPVSVSGSPQRTLRATIGDQNYTIGFQTTPSASEITVARSDGKKLISRTDRKGVLTVSDGSGTSIRAEGCRFPLERATRTFDPTLLALIDVENLSALSGGSSAAPVDGFRLAGRDTADLCCDEGSVSNCFPPGEDGTCGTGKELVTCAAGNCEILGTWNCC